MSGVNFRLTPVEGKKKQSQRKDLEKSPERARYNRFNLRILLIVARSLNWSEIKDNIHIFL